MRPLTGITRRVVVPDTTDDYAQRRQGYRRPAIIASDQQRQARYLGEAGQRRPLVCWTLGPFQRDNPAASGDNTYLMRVFNASAAGTLAMETGDAPLRVAGNIVGGVLWAGSDRTAGSATLAAQISYAGATTSVTFPEAIIDGSTELDGTTILRRAGFHRPFANGVRFAAGSLVRAQVVIAGFTPNTADFTAYLVVAYEDPS